MLPRRLSLGALPLILICNLAAMPARAQAPTSPDQVEGGATPQAPGVEKFSEGQILQLVAPIALYPDSLLSQILMASTYPLEVVEAARWLQRNPALIGKALDDAMQAQAWDPSVKALTVLPQTLQMMNDRLEWTQALGDAVLAQQQDVFDAVQKLRAQAEVAGNLRSTPQQSVTEVPPPPGVAPSSGPQQTIVIEPVNPGVYYVPVYDPEVAYGAWPYPDYPPFYWTPPGFASTNIVSFAAGVAVGAAVWGGCDWGRRHVVIDTRRFNVVNRTNIDVGNNVWVHNAVHRGNVPYRNAFVARRFEGTVNPAARETLRTRIDIEPPKPPHLAGEGGGEAPRRIAPAISANRNTNPNLPRSGIGRPMSNPPQPQFLNRPRGEGRPEPIR